MGSGRLSIVRIASEDNPVKPFKRRKKGGFVAEFSMQEAELLANLVSQVIELLEDRNGACESSADPLAAMVGMSGPMVAPEDPALARLLPDGYRGSPDDATEFRRFTEQSLSAMKSANGGHVLESLSDAGLTAGLKKLEVELTEQQGWAWLKSLTDVRLALAARIGMRPKTTPKRSTTLTTNRSSPWSISMTGLVSCRNP
jgi:hypothetical protein